ncbi:MAG: hypothetical protein KTR16_12520 [Acidiferrobacterales bacterium]|nr:hypothetical protein [Acidiferrobacterales bacterium]
MSKVRESLEANMEFIRSQLPDELKASAESCLDHCETELDDLEVSRQQILHSLTEEVRETVDPETVLPESPIKPTMEEQKAMVKKALSEEFHADFEKNADQELAGE